MPSNSVKTGPDGKAYTVDGPDDAQIQAALARARAEARARIRGDEPFHVDPFAEPLDIVPTGPQSGQKNDPMWGRWVCSGCFREFGRYFTTCPYCKENHHDQRV